MADTDVTLSVDLDVADAEKTAEQLHKEIQKVFQSRDGEQSASLTQLELQMKQSISRVQELQEKMSSLGKARVATDFYQQISDDLEKVSLEYDRLKEKMRVFERDGGNVTSEKYHKWAIQLEELEKDYDYAIKKKKELEESGRAFRSGEETEEYKKTQLELDRINDKLKQQLVRHQEIVDKEQEHLAKQTGINTRVDKTTKSVNRLRDATERVRKSSNKAHTSMSEGFSNVHKVLKKGIWTILKYGLGIRSLYILFRKLRSAITEGFKNLGDSKISKYTEQINNLKASLANIKNAFAGAFEPIVTTILPYLQRLVDWLTMAIDKMAQFIAALKGQKTYIRAIKQLGSAVEEAGNKAKGSLAGFDKLNNMTSDSGSGGAGGGAGSMFENAFIDSEIYKYVEKFKDAINKLKEAVKPTTDALKKLWNEGLSKLANFTWQGLKDFWEEFLKPLGMWAFGTEDKGLPRLINIINDDLNSIDWDSWNTTLKNFWATLEPFAEAVGEGLIDFLEEVGDLSVDILNGILGEGGVLDDFTGIIAKLDPEGVRTATKYTAWGLVLAKLLKFIGNIWAKWGPIISNAWISLKGIVAGLVGFFSQNPEALVFWVETFKQLFNEIFPSASKAIDEFVDEVEKKLEPFFDFWDKLIQFIFAPLQAISNPQLVIDFWNDLTDVISRFKDAVFKNEGYSFKQFVDDTISGIKQNSDPITADDIVDPNLTTDVTDAGENSALGFIQGLSEHPIVSGVLGFFTSNVITPLINLFEIGSPSKLMERIANFVIDGFLNPFDTLAQKFGTIWENVKNALYTPINAMIDILNRFLGACQTMQNAIADTFNNLSFDIPSWVPAIGGNHVGFSINKWTAPQIPRLAEGAVIPPNRQFLAMLGDQNSGTNIEAPLSTIEQAVRNVLDTVEIHVHMDVQGDPDHMFKIIRKEAQTFNKSHGYSAFA